MFEFIYLKNRQTKVLHDLLGWLHPDYPVAILDTSFDDWIYLLDWGSFSIEVRNEHDKPIRSFLTFDSFLSHYMNRDSNLKEYQSNDILTVHKKLGDYFTAVVVYNMNNVHLPRIDETTLKTFFNNVFKAKR